MAYGAFQKSESQQNPAVGESPENQLATRVLWAGRGVVGTVLQRVRAVVVGHISSAVRVRQRAKATPVERSHPAHGRKQKTPRTKMTQIRRARVEDCSKLAEIMVNYCQLVWGTGTQTALRKLHVLQKKALRIIYNLTRDDPSAQLFQAADIPKRHRSDIAFTDADAIISRLQKNGFGEDPVFDCFVAEDGSTADTGIVGYVMVSRIYSSWQGKSLRIGDLYVIEDHRRKGIGTQLLRRVMKECEDQGCRRIDCSPQLVNKALISFLKKHGAMDMTSEDGWSYYQLSQENMQKLVATSIK